MTHDLVYMSRPTATRVDVSPAAFMWLFLVVRFGFSRLVWVSRGLSQHWGC